MKDYWSTITEGNRLYQMGPQSHRIYLLNLLQRLVAESLLDVGCGTGPIYDLIRKKDMLGDKIFQIQRYKGIDPSPSMIETCKYHFPEGEFEVQNATHLLEKDNSWDCLVYMHSFDYIYDYMQALKEAYRVAKTHVIIILWQPLNEAAGSTHRLNNSINGVEAVDWDTARLQHFSWPQLEKEIKEIGFKVYLKKSDAEINQEGRNNTLLVLKKP